MEKTINVYDPYTGRFTVVDGGIGVLRIVNTLNGIMDICGHVTYNDIGDVLGFPRNPFGGDTIGIIPKAGYRFMIRMARDEEDKIEIGLLLYDESLD